MTAHLGLQLTQWSTNNQKGYIRHLAKPLYIYLYSCIHYMESSIESRLLVQALLVLAQLKVCWLLDQLISLNLKFCWTNEDDTC